MQQPKHSQQTRIRNLSLAGVAGLAGLVSVIITFVALFAGLWLDSRTQQDGTFTVIALVVSVPVSLFTMLKLVIEMVRRIVPQPATPRALMQHTPQGEEDVL